MPKTATARNNVTNWNKGGMLGKKKFVSSQEKGSVGRLETETFFGAALSWKVLTWKQWKSMLNWLFSFGQWMALCGVFSIQRFMLAQGHSDSITVQVVDGLIWFWCGLFSWYLKVLWKANPMRYILRYFRWEILEKPQNVSQRQCRCHWLTNWLPSWRSLQAKRCRNCLWSSCICK